MKSFPQKLWQSPVGKSLTALLTVTTGIVVVHLSGPSGEVRLPAKTATELLLLALGLLFSVCGVAYSYWKKCQPSEKIAAAQAQGRPICHCTEDGVVMLVDAKRSNATFWEYVCPKCGIHNSGMAPGMLSARKR
jgi:hypothetical protein